MAGWRSQIGGYIVLACVAAALYTIFVWTPWDPGEPEIRQTPAHPCRGWTEWEDNAPEMSDLFPIHWSIMDGEVLTKQEYDYWIDEVKRVQRELAEAPPAPFELAEFLEWAQKWLRHLRYMLVDLHNNEGVNLAGFDYPRLEYLSDQMGVAWGDAILACPPSERD